MATAHVNGSYGHGGEALAMPPAIPPRRGAAVPPRTRLLGELLVREGLVTEAQLSVALRGQESGSDGTPIGQLLVEQGALSPTDLEAVLKRYHKKYRLGDILVETNAISETQLQLAVDHHRRTGLRLGDAMLQLGFVNEETLKHALCTQLDVAFVDLDRFFIDQSLAALVSKAFAQQHRVLPVARVDDGLTVALADPTDGWVAENLETMTGCRVRLVMSTDAAFQRAFTRSTASTPGSALPASTSGSSRRTRRSPASTRTPSGRWASCAGRTRTSSRTSRSSSGSPPSRPGSRARTSAGSRSSRWRTSRSARSTRPGDRPTPSSAAPRRRPWRAFGRSGASTGGCWRITAISDGSSSRSGNGAPSWRAGWPSWRPRTTSGAGSSTSVSGR